MAFQALRETYDLVTLEGTKRVEEVFLRFYLSLVGWLTSKCSPETHSKIFQEHISFVDLMQFDGFLDHADSGVRRWEFWEMPILNDNTERGQLSILMDSSISEYSIVLAEMSRLKRLAAEFRQENGALRSENEVLTSENEVLTSENEVLKSENEVLKSENVILGVDNSRLRQVASRRIVRIAMLVGDFLHAKLCVKW
jgi:regulator of replication initiation timing